MTSPPSPPKSDDQQLLLGQIAEIMASVDTAVRDRERNLPGLLRRARDAGISVPELADLTGYTRQYVYRLLSVGEGANPIP